MNANEEIICRLCLKVSHSGFLFIDEAAKQGLGVLSVNMNFDVSNDPLMCEDCAETIERSLSFLLACLEAEKAILMFGSGKDAISIDLRDVYAYKSKEIAFTDSFVCRFCIKKVEERSCIPLEVLMRENGFIDAFKGCMSMLGLSIIKNSLICIHCRDRMEGYIRFLWNCRGTEQKINMYQCNEGIKSPKKIVLSNVFEQFSKYILEYFNKHTQMCEMMIDRSAREVTEIEFTDIYNMVEKESATKDKEMDNFLLRQDGDVSDRILRTCGTRVSSCLGCRVRAHETLSVTDNVKVEAECWDVNEELQIKSEELNVKDEVPLSEGTHPSKLQKSGVCMCNKKGESCSKCDSKLEIVSKKPILYKCINIKYKCTACNFKTKYKGYLKTHLLTHKTETELTMFKCTICDFKTKRKHNLKSHLLTHKTEAELTMYKCTICGFKTKYKQSLKTHLLTHNNEAKVTIYECETCEFITKYKRSLEVHSLIHKTEAEVTMFKCTICDFKTKHKYYLKRHLLLTHKTEAEITVYECTVCNFKTKYKHCLRMHLLTHKTEAELTMYKCTACDFKTKRKYGLKTHLLTHNNHDTNGKAGVTICSLRGASTDACV